MNFFRHLIRGCSDLPGYGPHPGTSTTLLYIFIAGLAGAQRGSWAGFFGGAAIGALFFVPLYLYGAYSRSKECDDAQKRLLRKIKDA